MRKFHPAYRNDFSRHFLKTNMVGLKLVIVPLVLSILTGFTAMMLQLYGAILLWKMHLRQQEDAVCMLSLRKQCYWRRKCKRIRQRYLTRLDGLIYGGKIY
jgi:hypothetical protein